MPGGVPAPTLFLSQIVAGTVLVIGLWPLARGLAAKTPGRAAAVIGFVLLVFGVNGLIEAKKFTSFLDGGIGSAAAFYISLAIFVGGAEGMLFGSTGQPAGLPHRSWSGWTWRSAVAWIGWPVVWTFFGMCIAPIVVPYYRAGIAGLRIPPMDVVIEMQLIRSALFLAASLPFIALWKGTRRGLWLTLGLAHAFTVGLYGLVGATFLPMALRATHAVEMTCDGFAYAGLLVVLFGAPAPSVADATPALHDPRPQPL